MKRHKFMLLVWAAIGCSGGGQTGPTPVGASDGGAAQEAGPSRPAPATCAGYCSRAASVGCPEISQAECTAACESIEPDGPCSAQMQEQVNCGAAKPAEQWSCDLSGEATPGCAGEAMLTDCLAQHYAMCDSGALILADWWCDGQVDCADGSDENC